MTAVLLKSMKYLLGLEKKVSTFDHRRRQELYPHVTTTTISVLVSATFFQFAAVLKETYEAQELEGYRTAEDGDYSDDEYHSVYDFAEVDGENSEFDGEWSDDDFGMYGDVDAYHTMI
mmetsp:Transcript_5003/g.5792  ORF Transcript_5003/g.5792 Transcript_5003/m.5792 type:complete len:118 (+) Transcript_5003:1573-1926(+)